MNKKKNKSHSHQSSNNKGSDNHPPYNWGNAFAKLCSRLHKYSWIQNIIVGFAVWLICSGIALYMKTPKIIIWGSAFGLIILICVFAYFLAAQFDDSEIKQPSSQQPSINVTSNNQQGGITAGVINNVVDPPRSLSREQQQVIISRLKSFAGSKTIDIWGISTDPECMRLYNQFIEAFSLAGIKLEQGSMMNGNGIEGIVLAVPNADKLTARGSAIVDALKKSKIQFLMVTGFPDWLPVPDKDSPEKIQIFIGSKPLNSK